MQLARRVFGAKAAVRRVQIDVVTLFFTESRFWGFFLLDLPAVFAFPNPVIFEVMQINPTYGRLLAF